MTPFGLVTWGASDEVVTFSELCATRVEWEAAFGAYDWHGDWRSGLTARRELARLLRLSLGEGDCQEAVDAITNWGRVPPLRDGDLRRTIESVRELERPGNEHRGGAKIFTKRIATVSKVYAMSDLDRWIIYDSRVAWALAALRERALATEEQSYPAIAPFHQPPARSAGGYPGAPPLRSDREARDDFLRASRLAQEIARRISSACPDPGGWTAVHVEMALFAMGGARSREEDYMTKDTKGVAKLMSPSSLTHAGLAKTGVSKALNNDVVRGTIDDQLATLIEGQLAKGRAMRFARQTDSVAASVQFADGPQRWVIFNNDVPIAAFPAFEGDLEEALRFHNFSRLQMRQPDELEREIAADKERRRKRWKLWAREASDHQVEVVAELLQLEAGDEAEAD